MADSIWERLYGQNERGLVQVPFAPVPKGNARSGADTFPPPNSGDEREDEEAGRDDENGGRDD